MKPAVRCLGGRLEMGVLHSWVACSTPATPSGGGEPGRTGQERAGLEVGRMVGQTGAELRKGTEVGVGWAGEGER